MKNRFTTLDLMAVMHDLRALTGMRVVNVYDVDNKTYLIKLQRPDQKAVILFESGIRIHPTAYDWPKETFPSGFSMKFRKHIKQKRLESVNQLGIDRIVDMQFGGDEKACHVIVELYDRGNVILTDVNYVILNVLRPRTDKDKDVRFAVRERYPIESARQALDFPSFETMKDCLLEKSKKSDSAASGEEILRKNLTGSVLFAHLGPALIEHCLLGGKFDPNCKIDENFKKDENDLRRLYETLKLAQQIFVDVKQRKCKGYLTIKKTEQLPDSDKTDISRNSTEMDEKSSRLLETYLDYHPVQCLQQKMDPGTNRRNKNRISDEAQDRKITANTEYFVQEFDSFSTAVDEFYSKRESQKAKLKTVQQERDAMKKLDNVRRDHATRLTDLESAQSSSERKGALIELNRDAVDKAIMVIRSAVANELTWEQVQELVDEAKSRRDPVALKISKLELDANQMTMLLADPYEESKDQLAVDIDLNFGAYKNARNYYDSKRAARLKTTKTIDASKKALKSAEHKTQQALKLVKIRAGVTKHRRTMWFEKFFWFISSENYLVIGGRDAQQNELIVKRHLGAGDVYVHADIRGASSIVIKNNNTGNRIASCEDIPPKTLNEAGAAAVCYSAAWEAKVVTGAWWVRHDQVSRTAPSGEYLIAGSFMIRGKKNYLLPVQLQMGFGYLFRLDEDSIERHRGERRVMNANEVLNEVANEVTNEVMITENHEENDDGQEREENCSAESSSDSDSEHKEDEFPDVQIQMAQKSYIIDKNGIGDKNASDENDEWTILQVGPRRVENSAKQNLSTENRSNTGKTVQTGELLPEPTTITTTTQDTIPSNKRGQRHKQQKLKTKYRDQDADERDLRLQLLGSAGEKRPDKRAARKARQQRKQMGLPLKSTTAKSLIPIGERDKTSAVDKVIEAAEITSISSSKADEALNDVKNVDVFVDREATCAVVEVEEEHTKETISSRTGVDAANDSDEEEPNEDLTSEWAILETLTAVPLPEDGLLFAVPVCAPYQVMTNYKYKVKLTPGTSKRGKASKTALTVFAKDRCGTQLEKDLIKATGQDQDLTRNMPGKVKVSAPLLSKLKKGEK